ncbi:hypothetical protein DOTSEDRAFT_62752 [Dothistroma septosporum NZE10]|uniref:FAD-binding domain-containing protein n=1 Tax=Dothistroma septosporum (strain NZE10 / CBS 128990) TaxID=675120 RepID=N1PMY5_DOTSN|nr:hypothetical protein DOTSEDRAFT_62752 [Dothistroma septosporum NZE10]
MTTNSRRILVNGGGPAGSIAVFWLAKAGSNVLVTERATSRPFGQGIDVTNRAVDVIENKRSDLTRATVDAAKAFQDVGYRYGRTIEAIEQHDRDVTVRVSGSDTPEHFHAVTGADGLRSRVRNVTFDNQADAKCWAPTNTYAGFFSMIRDSDRDIPFGKNSIQHRTPNRVDPPNRSERDQIFRLPHAHKQVTEFERIAESRSTEEHKAALANLSSAIRGVAPRAVRGMYAAEDFYYTRIVQIKLDSWHRGRCALVGMPDTRHLRLLDKMARCPDDLNVAFTKHHQVVKKFVKDSQSVPLGGKAPESINPKSAWGILILRLLFWFVSVTRIWRWFVFGNETFKMKLPEHEFTMEE